MKNTTIGLINLGCAKNLVDAELMLGILSEKGYSINLEEDEADIVLVNTCSFVKDAEKESVKAIVEIAESGKKLIITGCLAQKYKQELLDAVPEAMAIVGTGDIDKIAEIVEGLAHNKKAVYQISEKPTYLQTDDIKRFQITMGPSSYIKIAEGCDYTCAYCIIPSLRGSYRSRPIESIVDEARRLGQDGVSEIIIVAQDTTSYGKDLYGKPSLARLLEKLNDIEEISWIRIMYTFPSLINDDLINAIASLEKVVKYIDLPLQHSHPDILRLMNRPVMDNAVILDKIRNKIPDATLRTAFIVGFPGEKQQHYEHLYEFIKTQRFDKLGVFEYSKEKNTQSYGMKEQVLAKDKKKRRKEIMQLQQGISREKNQALIGKTMPAIIDMIDSSGKIIGRTHRDAPEIDGLAYITSKELIVPGEIVFVKITEASEYDLFADVSDTKHLTK